MSRFWGKYYQFHRYIKAKKHQNAPKKTKPESKSKKRAYTKYPKGIHKKEKKQQKSQSEKKVKKGVDKKEKLWYNNKVVRRGH